MPYYPDPAGGSMYVSGEPEARERGWTPSMGTYGLYTTGEIGAPPTGGGSTPSGPGSTVPQQQSAAQQLGYYAQQLLMAQSQGNQQLFDETVRQFNATFGLDQEKFHEAIRQYNENLAISAAGLTGQYQGQQTLQNQLQQANIAAQQAGLTGWYQAPTTTPGGGGGSALAQYPPGTVVRTAGNQFGVVGPNGTLTVGDVSNPTIYQAVQAGQGIPTVSDADFTTGQSAAQAQPQRQMTLAAQNQAYNQAMGMINAAAQLQANPFRQAQAIGQMSQLLGGGGVAGFQAPNTVQNAAGAQQPGGAFSGMNNMQAMIDDIRGGPQGTNSIDPNAMLEQIPTPNKVNSTEFMRMSPQGQNMVLSGIQSKYGIEPTDALAQIKNTLPSFTAPSTTFGTFRR